MANELRVTHITGKVVYFQVWNNVGQIYNTSTLAFEAYATANIANYAISSTEAGTASGVYLGTMPSISAGQYSIDARERAGGSVAETDLVVGSGVLVWNGTTLSADSWQARLFLTDDNTNSADRYVIIWFKNAQPITNGITSPTIQVFDSNGTDLIVSTAMSQIGSTGTYKYVASGVERITSGVAYIALARATIEGATRSWYMPVSRDT